MNGHVLDIGIGQKWYGSLEGPRTHGGFTAHIPLHVVRGAADGPTLVVQAGLSGLEIEPAMILPRVVDELDPATLRGTVVVIPLLNTSGFEFEQVNAVWDDKNLTQIGRGRANGTVSEQLMDRYYREVIAPADALVDIRTGAQWGYFRYAGVYATGDQTGSRALAADLGLPQVLLGQPADGSTAYEAAQDGKRVVSAWIGGGPGLRDHRDEDMARVRRAVLNATQHLGILNGEIERKDGPAQIVQCHTVLGIPTERGFTFVDKTKRGQPVAAGEKIGYVKHPFTGDIIYDITAPRAGVMLHAGASWPILPEGVTLAILGDPV
jgi:uncharacterized protein